MDRYNNVQYLRYEKRRNQIIRPFMTMACFALFGPFGGAAALGFGMLSEHCSNLEIRDAERNTAP